MFLPSSIFIINIDNTKKHHMDNLTALTLVSIIYIILGLLLRFLTPGINRFYGYRTEASMANEVNWNFSQKYSGVLFALFGLLLLLIVFVLEYAKIDVTNNIGKAGVGILILGSAITTIVLTERAIKKNSKNN